jgi:hypothetical protein
MTGYSGTPLPKKLGLRATDRVWVVGAPDPVGAELRLAVRGSTSRSARRGPIDFATVFSTSASDLMRRVAEVEPRIAPSGILWLAWPKRASGVPSDLSDESVRKIGLAAGLVDVKVCAISEVWSGLKFVRRVRDRGPPERGRRPRNRSVRSSGGNRVAG